MKHIADIVELYKSQKFLDQKSPALHSSNVQIWTDMYINAISFNAFITFSYFKVRLRVSMRLLHSTDKRA